MRVLVVEDELKMAALLKQGLEEHGHSVTVVHDGLEALEVVSAHAFEVVVLDVMLPILDGFEVARRLRKSHKQVPILMLTARDAVPDIARGLDVGADDYLTKPFSFMELLARIRALGRRPPAMLPPQLSVGDLILDPGSRRVARGDEEVSLTATEYRLLEFLMRRSGQVVPRGAIVEAVWGFNEEIENNTLEAFVSSLRNKIDRGFSRKLIHTVRGVWLLRAGERFAVKAISIRKQLTAWYFLIVAVALIGFAVFALRVMRQSIYSTVDEQLEDRARSLQVLIANSAPADVANELQEHAELQSGSQLFQVSDSSGHFLYRSRVMERLGVPAAQPDSQFKNAEYGELPLRILTTTATASERAYVVQVAEPMDDFLEAVDRFRTAMLFGIPLLLFAAAVGGYWMSLRAMQPVERITLAAEAITPQDLSQRVTVPQTDDELQRLAETLNGMLQRIDSAVARITQFTADASHELRTPVALIRTRAEVTLGNPRTDDQYRDALQEVLAEAERTSSLIENLMLLARSDTGSEALHFERTDLSALARDFSMQGKTLANAKQLGWKTVISDTPTWVRGDTQSLRRLLLILIDNAVKYTVQGGSVALAVRSKSKTAEIEVRDTGIGISETDLPHIFERFYRADKARSRELGGTGLGLSIGRWIVQAHGGEILVESTSGAGSTFLVRLPLEPS